MTAFQSWFAMGGYGAFVWPAYAVAVGVLGGLAIWSWQRHRRSIDALARLQGQSGARG